VSGSYADLMKTGNRIAGTVQAGNCRLHMRVHDKLATTIHASPEGRRQQRLRLESETRIQTVKNEIDPERPYATRPAPDDELVRPGHDVDLQFLHYRAIGVTQTSAFGQDRRNLSGIRAQKPRVTNHIFRGAVNGDAPGRSLIPVAYRAKPDDAAKDRTCDTGDARKDVLYSSGDEKRPRLAAEMTQSYLEAVRSLDDAGNAAIDDPRPELARLTAQVRQQILAADARRETRTVVAPWNIASATGPAVGKDHAAMKARQIDCCGQARGPAAHDQTVEGRGPRFTRVRHDVEYQPGRHS